MSEWTPPSAIPIAQEYPRHESDGLRRLVDMVVGLKTEMREMRSNLLGPAGLSVYPNGLTTDGDFNVNGSAIVAGNLASAEYGTGTGWSLAGSGDADFTGTTHIGGATDIDGTLNVDAATTIGGTLEVTGDATFGGAVAITGTLSLPAGIIDNDALANPVTFAGNEGSLNATVPPTSWGTATTANLTVPDWATAGVIMASGYVSATSGASGGTISGRIVINGNTGTASTLALDPSDNVSQPVLHQLTIADAGTTITVSIQWQASATFAGGAARLVATGMFSR